MATQPSLMKQSETIAYYESKIASLFYKKYQFDENYYCTCLINDIIYNEKSHIVALFKNYLILDDDSEFLKRFYTQAESSTRLPKFFEYYETYSKIFPNYTVLTESKYIFKNIHKKQKMIDLQQENDSENTKEKDHKAINESKDKTDDVFSTDVYNSIVNDHDDIALLFNIKRDINDTEAKDDVEDNEIGRISALIEVIAVKERKINSNQMNNCKTSSVDYDSSKKPLLTPRIDSSKHPNILNRLIPRVNNESISRLIQQELLIQTKRNGVNYYNEPSMKTFRNDKMLFVNSKSNSIDHKSHNSTTLSQQMTSNVIRPLTHRESSSKQSEAQKTNRIESCIPPQTERIRVNIRPIKEEETQKLKKTIISQIRANNRFFFQSKIIASQFNQNFKLGNAIRENLLSPQSTMRKIATERDINSINTLIVKNDKHQGCKKELELIKACKPQETKRKQNSSSKKNDIKPKEAGMVTTRPKSRTSHQFNISNQKMPPNGHTNNKPKHLVINEKKGVSTYHIPLPIQPSLAHSPMKKIVKGIEIKNFSKALGLLEMQIPLQKPNTERLEKSKASKCRSSKVNGSFGYHFNNN